MAAFTKNLHFEVLLKEENYYNGKSIPAHQKAHKRDQNNCTQPCLTPMYVGKFILILNFTLILLRL